MTGDRRYQESSERYARGATWRLAIAGLLLVVTLAYGASQTTLAAWFDTDVITGNQVAADVWNSTEVPAECAHILIDNVITGTEVSDLITGTNKNDLIFGFGGNDVIQGGNGDDCIVGGAGNDLLGGDRQLENGQDVLLGGDGNDILDGGNAKDLLYGGPGDDLLDGRNGKDLVYGQSGTDQLRGANGTDLLHGGDSLTTPDTELDSCEGGRAPDVYEKCEIIDGVAVTP